MENTINYNEKEIKWEYTICPCLQCPIYPTKREWEEEAERDVRKDRCYSSRCSYNKKLAASIAQGIYELRFNKDCDEDY